MKENFCRVDANSDGGVSEEEFVKAMAAFAGGGQPNQPAGAPRGPMDAKQAEELFDRTDANSDGKVTKDEVPEDKREGFGRMLERIGADSVTKEQFVRFLMAQGGQPGQPGQPRPNDARPEGGFRPPVIAALDADGDGELSGGEIEAAAKALLKLDKNSDGKLTREELAPQFGGGFRPGQPGQPGPGRFNPGELGERLRAADANKDGKLSKEEAPDMLKERFDRVDGNSDGFVDETEIKQMFERMREGLGNRPNGDGPRRPGGGDNAPRRPDAEKP
jgi:Ca2+-binding EF-hand superfamily protein